MLQCLPKGTQFISKQQRASATFALKVQWWGSLNVRGTEAEADHENFIPLMKQTRQAQSAGWQKLNDPNCFPHLTRLAISRQRRQKYWALAPAGQPLTLVSHFSLSLQLTLTYCSPYSPKNNSQQQHKTCLNKGHKLDTRAQSTRQRNTKRQKHYTALRCLACCKGPSFSSLYKKRPSIKIEEHIFSFSRCKHLQM